MKDTVERLTRTTPKTTRYTGHRTYILFAGSQTYQLCTYCGEVYMSRSRHILGASRWLIGITLDQKHTHQMRSKKWAEVSNEKRVEASTR